MKDRRLVEFDRLNLLGKAIYTGGVVASIAGRVIEATVDRATSIAVDAERAFREGFGDGIEDARILSEDERPQKTDAPAD